MTDVSRTVSAWLLRRPFARLLKTKTLPVFCHEHWAQCALWLAFSRPGLPEGPMLGHVFGLRPVPWKNAPDWLHVLLTQGSAPQ